jgi:hypothetical protein
MYKPKNFPFDTLQTSLDKGQWFDGNGPTVLLSLTVTNLGSENACFCDYHTPFEGIRNDFLTVIGPDGKQMHYLGMMAKRLPPTEKNFSEVGPGKSVRVGFDAWKGYSFSEPGIYRVQFLGNETINGLPDSGFIEIEVG